MGLSFDLVAAGDFTTAGGVAAGQIALPNTPALVGQSFRHQMVTRTGGRTEFVDQLLAAQYRTAVARAKRLFGFPNEPVTLICDYCCRTGSSKSRPKARPSGHCRT